MNKFNFSFDKAKAGAIYADTEIRVDSFRKAITIRPKSIMLGYADVTVTSKAGLSISLRGLAVKLLGQNIHLDMPAESYTKGGETQYVPHLYPRSAETRAVLTIGVFQHPSVAETVEEAGKLAAQQDDQQEETRSDNPFGA